ncbi:MAG: hypothetical protein WDM90_02270 [Ferruginibacter sp.]
MENSETNNREIENRIKQKCAEVLGILKGLTVAQAKLVLDIVTEDFSATAVIS